jgi:hypothetical protein
MQNRTHLTALFLGLWLCTLLTLPTLAGKKPQAVTITTPPALTNLCVGSSTYTPLGNIVFTEGAVGDIDNGNNRTFEILMPAGFELNAGTGTATIGGTDITLDAITVLTNKIMIQMDVDMASTSVSNSITISGLEIRSTAVGMSLNMTYSAGSAVFTGLADGATCATLSSVDPSTPNLTVGNTQSFCVGTDVGTTLATVAGGGTVNWYNDAGLTSLQTTGATRSFTQLGISTLSANTKTLYVRRTVGGCLSATATVIININAQPLVNVFVSSATICQGQTTTFIATSAVGNEFRFELKKGSVSQAIQAYSTTPFYITSASLVAGTDYTMEVTARDGANCESTVNTTAFTIAPLPTAPTVAEGTTITYCVGATLGNITGEPTAASGNTIEWFGDASLSAVLASSSGAGVSLSTLGISSASVNTYQRYVTQKTGANCRSSATLVTIQIVANPVVVLTSDLPTSPPASANKVCFGTVVNFTASGSASLDYRFDLDGVLGTFSATNTFATATTLAVGNHTMVVTGRNSNNCTTASTTIAFEVLAVPTVTFTTPTPSSFLDSQTTGVDLASLVSPANGVGGTGVFSGEGMVGTQFFPNLAGTAGSKIITYTFTATNGCVKTAQITLVVNQSGFFVAQGYCNDDAPSLVVGPAVHIGTPCGDVTNVFGNITGFITGSQPSFYVNPTAVSIPVGSDFVTWNGVGQTQFCGTGFGGFAISTRIYRVPNPAFTGNATVCQGDNNISYSVPFVNNNTYAWTIVPSTAGTILSGQGTNSITINWIESGNQILRLVQTANYTSPTITCPKTADYNITVNESPTPAISPTSATVCETTTGHVYSVTSSANRSYLWTVSANGTITAGAGTNSITVTWNTAGAGTVSVVETNTITSCNKSATQNITINALPNPNFNVVNVCEGLTGVNYSTTNNVGSTYTWTITNGSITAGASTNAVTVNWNLGFTSGDLTVQETNSNGCVRSVTKTVIFNPRPTATISNVIGTFGNFACQSSVGNQYTTNADANTYVWTITNGTITAGAGTNTVTVSWNASATGTIAVTKTNSSGCVNSVTENINLNAPPVAAITGLASPCQNTSQDYTVTNPVSGHTYSWSVVGGTINGASNGTTINVTWTNLVSGTVNLTQTSNVTPTFCAHSASLPITMLALPTPSISGNGVTVATFACENTNGVIYQTPAVAGASYEWTITGGIITAPATAPYNSNQITVNWANAGARIITLKQTNPNGCVANTSANVDVKPRPTPNIFGNIEVCATSTDVEYFTPNTGNNYSWTVVSGGTISANLGDKIRVNWGTGTSGQISLVETNPTTGCNQTTTRNITIRPLPTPTVVGDNDVCATESGVTYQVANVTGHQYTWTVTGGAIATGQGTNSITVNWGTGTAGTVQVLQTDNNFATACPRTNTLNVTINALPTPNIVGDATVCATSTGSNYQTASVVGSTYVWTVIGGTIVGSATGNAISINWGTTVSGTVTVEETNNKGCVTTVSRNISILPLPTPSIAGTLEVCANQTAPNAYPYQYSTSLVGGHTYIWVITGGTIVNGQNTNQVTVTWNTGAGTGTLRVTQTSNTTPACTFFNEKTITIRDLPEPVIAGNVQVCAEDDVVNYQVANLTGHTYLWTVSGGIIASGQSTHAITVDWGTSATGTVQVSVQNTTNPANCTKTVSQAITINPLPTPDIAGAFTVCANSTGNTYLVANVIGHSFVWTVTNGTITSGQGTNQIQVTWNAQASGTVSVLQTNTATNCQKVNTKNIVILPLPTPDVIGTFTVCASTDNTNFYDYVYTTAAITGHTYFWTVTNGVIRTNPNNNQITVRWNTGTTAGTIRVTQTSNTAPACTFFDEKPIIINAVPVTDVTLAAFCFNDVTTFIPTISDPSWTWNWGFSDGSTANTPTVNKVFTTTGAKIMNLTITNPAGCEYKIQKNFIINPIPVPDFKYLGSCKNTTMQFTDLSTVANPDNLAKWTWDFGDNTTLSGTNPAIHKNPVHVYNNVGQYTVKLIVETNNVCIREITKIISVYPSFSPTNTTPYVETFETGDGGWIPAGTQSSWERGTPASTRTIKPTKPTDKMWTTGLNANYNNAQSSHLESPCFDLTNLPRPHIAIKMWNNTDAGSDGANLFVTHDDGLTWELVGEVGEGLDWYNESNILAPPGGRKEGWSGKDATWRVARFPLDVIKTKPQPVRFRIAFASNLDNPAEVLDGVAIDSIFIGSRNRIVLLENFTRGNNVQPILDAHTHLTNFPGTQEEIAKVQYFTNFATSPNDTGNDQLNRDNPAEPSARALYYGINTVPRAMIDGKDGKTSPTAPLLSQWGLKKYNQQVLLPSPFQIQVSFPTNPSGEFTIEAKVKAIQPINKPVVIHMMIVEREIDGSAVGVSTPAGLKFRYVVKKMLPSAAGTFEAQPWTIGTERTYTQSVALYNSTIQSNGVVTKIYNSNNIDVVVFVQDDATKEVYQTLPIRPTTVPTLITASEPTLRLPAVRLYPNPAEDTFTLDLGEELPATCTWELCNAMGAVVGKGNLQAGTKQARLQVSQYPRGLYLLRITQPKTKQTATYKVVFR